MITKDSTTKTRPPRQTPEESRMYNARDLEKEMAWLEKVISVAINLHFANEQAYNATDEIPMPDLSQSPSRYARYIRAYGMGIQEREVLCKS